MLSTDSPKTASAVEEHDEPEPAPVQPRSRRGSGAGPGSGRSRAPASAGALRRRGAGTPGSARPARTPRPRTSRDTACSGSASPSTTARAMSSAIVAHLVLAHPLRRDARGADPDAGRDVGLLRVERDGVLVQGDAGRVAAGLGVDAGDHDPLEVVQRQVGVGAAGRRPDAVLAAAPAASTLALATTWRAYSAYSGVAHSLKFTALAAMVCICGPPCIIGKTALSMRRGVLRLAHDGAASAGRAAPCGS